MQAEHRGNRRRTGLRRRSFRNFLKTTAIVSMALGGASIGSFECARDVPHDAFRRTTGRPKRLARNACFHDRRESRRLCSAGNIGRARRVRKMAPESAFSPTMSSGSAMGYAYSLANGTELTGARVSFFDIDPATLAVCGAGTSPSTRSTTEAATGSHVPGISTSAASTACARAACMEVGELGFQDRVYLAGEESSGGTEFALDVDRGELWAVPALGRAAFENVAPLDSGDGDTVALLIGDDRVGVALLLYRRYQASGELPREEWTRPGPSPCVGGRQRRHFSRRLERDRNHSRRSIPGNRLFSA